MVIAWMQLARVKGFSMARFGLARAWMARAAKGLA